MQIMGDWAKGEFLKAGQKPGTDFVCIRFPGTQGLVSFNSDQFAMFKVKGDAAAAGAAFEAALRLQPTFAKAHNNLGVLYQGNRKPYPLERKTTVASPADLAAEFAL